MKKMISIIVLLSLILGYTTCSNDNEMVPANTDENGVLSIEERYAITKEIATYHSEGLNFAYNKLKEIREIEKLSSSEVFLRDESKEDQLALINAVVNEFMSQELVSNLSKFDSKIKFINAENTIQENAFRSDNENEEKIIKIFSFFDNIVNTITDLSLLELTIQNAINSEEFASFSEIEQNELLAMFAVFEDSANYWSKNSGKWDELLEGENNLRTDIPKNPNKLIVEADAIGYFAGSIGGAITGGIIGAITGSIAGGAGALPGGIIGWAAGAIGGGIGAAVTASLTVYMMGSSGGDCSITIQIPGYGIKEIN
jgi:hypothetical protein